MAGGAAGGRKIRGEKETTTKKQKRGRRRGNLNCGQSGRDAAGGCLVDQFDWLGRWHQISSNWSHISSLYVPPFGKRDQLIRGTRWIAYPLNEFCGAFCSNYSFHPSQIRVWSIWIARSPSNSYLQKLFWRLPSAWVRFKVLSRAEQINPSGGER